VQVSPELVQVSTAVAKWQAPFEAPLTDVFQVQGQIAGQVAQALGVALGVGERERLAETPTENLAAYDAFLKGEQATQGFEAGEFMTLRRAIDYYERAVALDSTFALAWAQLSRAHSNIYWLWTTPPAAEAGVARRAAERALALAPERPEGYLALGDYYGSVWYEPAQALEQYIKGEHLAPKDARLLSAVASAELGLGRAEDGLAHLRKAVVLDPLSIETAVNMVYALVQLRRYDDALAAGKRAMALAPANLRVIGAEVVVHLARGDLAGSRAVVRAVPREVDPTALVAYIAVFDDLYWLLDDAQQQLLLRLSPEPFGGSRAAWGVALAATHALHGDAALAQAYADSARLAIEARLRDVPQEAYGHAYLGLMLAYLGRKTEAIREGERGMALMPISKNAGVGGEVQRVLAWTYVLVGEPERALDRLEALLELPSYWVSPAWLQIDPAYAPLRGNPRFERLVNRQ
jgi:serine/threonine-protein kinase